MKESNTTRACYAAESDLAKVYKDTSDDAEVDYLQPAIVAAHGNVWQSTFSPKKNVNMDERIGRSAYDVVDNKASSPSVWQQIVKADHIKRVSFKHFDKDGAHRQLAKRH